MAELTKILCKPASFSIKVSAMNAALLYQKQSLYQSYKSRQVFFCFYKKPGYIRNSTLGPPKIKILLELQKSFAFC